MTNLTPAIRRTMPASDFAAGPGHYPINDPAHARLAISGASRAENVGNISPAKAAMIKAKARAKLRQFGSLVHDDE